VIPSQGSVGASGDLAPLAHMAAAMIGEGEAILAASACLPAKRWRKAGLNPSCWAQGRPGADQRHAILHRLRAGRSVRRANAAMRGGASSPAALSTDAIMGSTAPLAPSIHALRGHRGQIDVAAAMRA
jgi:histidine ammonia-lyase